MMFNCHNNFLDFSKTIKVTVRVLEKNFPKYYEKIRPLLRTLENVYSNSIVFFFFFFKVFR